MEVHYSAFCNVFFQEAAASNTDLQVNKTALKVVQERELLEGRLFQCQQEALQKDVQVG